MRFTSFIAAATMIVGLASAAQAAPMLQNTIAVGPAPQIELVRGGCGLGEHRSYSGYCHYNHGWRGRARYRANHWY